jgi:hypothetical protein
VCGTVVDVMEDSVEIKRKKDLYHRFSPDIEYFLNRMKKAHDRSEQATPMEIVVEMKYEDDAPIRDPKVIPKIARLLEQAEEKERCRQLQKGADVPATIEIDGNSYTAAQIDQELVDLIEDPDEFDRVMDFVARNS